MSLKSILTKQLELAIVKAGYEQCDPIIKVSGKPEFGDYQANFAMGLAKERGKNPRELAQEVVGKIKLGETFEKVEVAGPGFINLHLKPEFIAEQLQKFGCDEHFGVQKNANSEIVVVDYGGPNVAKEMHVGHLRSLVIGDAIVRVLEFLGYTVIRQNHIGDWGTQFGMLIENIIERNLTDLSDLNQIYQESKKRYDAESDFAERARLRVVKLQQGDAETKALWLKLVNRSKDDFMEVYGDLGVLLTNDDYRGESTYNDDLPKIVNELESSQIAEHSEGAKVVFLDGFVDKDNNPVPFIIQKSDGGYLYATTDLAAIKYRLEKLQAQRLIYVIDARQSQHMAMLFATARKAGWVGDNVKLEHAAFGSVLGEDHKPFKTRSGETVKLNDLFAEAKERAEQALIEKRPDIQEIYRKNIYSPIAYAAIKYGDLSSDRVKDYVFSWERMLSFEGNSAPYILNAYARISAIFMKIADREMLAEFQQNTADPKTYIQMKKIVDTQCGTILANSEPCIFFVETIEKQLALKLLAFPDIIALVAKDLAPHHLCHYLFELANNFHAFYEHCSVLNAETAELKQSRELLCFITANVLKQGLELLGIHAIEHLLSAQEQHGNRKLM